VQITNKVNYSKSLSWNWERLGGESERGERMEKRKKERERGKERKV
jgi:hypothetical protein